VTKSPPTATIEELTTIWQRVLKRTPVGSGDDFFALGGDASRATELFSEIAEQFGTTLCPATICVAPTIAALANAVSAPQPAEPLVLLKPGAGGPPVFMTHGIGSSVIDLVPVVRRMRCDQAIYGMEAKGNDGVEQPLDRIEDMAQFFLDAVRRVQPHGPYFLIGYSLGGLVTLEMGRQLLQEGEQIRLLAMLDSYPDRHHLSFGQHARLLLRLLRERARKVVQPDGGVTAAGSLAQAMGKVREAHYCALRNYRPQYYDGRVKFVRAAILSQFPSNPIPVWSGLIGALEVETAPGDHVKMLRAEVDALASILTKFVREAGDAEGLGQRGALVDSL